MDISTDTPETDKAYLDVTVGGSRYSFPEHARRMERERNEARAEILVLRKVIQNLIGGVDASSAPF